MSHRRAVASVGVAVVVALVVLNVAGLARVPVGPLDGPPGGATLRVPYTADRGAMYVVPYVEDTWPVGVTVERIVPRGESVPGTVEVLGSLPFDTADPAQQGPDGTNLVMAFVGAERTSAWDRPDPATGVPVTPSAGRDAGRAFLVRVTPDATHETRVTSFDVEYRFGPFTFVAATRSAGGETVVFCGADRPALGDDGCEAV